MDDWFGFAGNRYPLWGGAPQGPPGVPSESAPDSFESMVSGVYRRSGIVAACIAALQPPPAAAGRDRFDVIVA